MVSLRHIGPQRSLFVNPHMKRSMLYLLPQSRRFWGCFETKVASQRLSTVVVARRRQEGKEYNGVLARSLAPVQNRQLHLITIPFRASPTTVVGKRRSVLILQVTKRNSNFGRNERTNQRCALQRFDLVGERWMMEGGDLQVV